MTPVDALFIATSAVCVTGLSVIDVSKETGVVSQLVLLSLIQIGGLGIMTGMMFMSLVRRLRRRRHTGRGEAFLHRHKVHLRP